MKKLFLFCLLAGPLVGGCATMESMAAKTKAVPGDVVVEEVTTIFDNKGGSSTVVKRVFKTQAAADLELKNNEMSSKTKVRVAEANRPPIVAPSYGYYDGYYYRHQHGVVGVGTRVRVGGHGGGHHRWEIPRGHR